MIKKKYQRLLVYLVSLVAFLALLYKISNSAEKTVKVEKTKERLVAKRDAVEDAISGIDDGVIRKLFKRADTTADRYLSPKELAWAVSIQVDRHLQAALRGNFKKFFALDKINHNGQVEWNEWLAHFKANIASQFEGEMSSRRAKEKLAAAKAAWSEAARTNGDALNIDEFLAFTHPESSHSMLAQTAEETFGRFDADSDNKMTLEEYLNEPFAELDDDEKIERESEFKEGMDANKDGIVIKRELLNFLNPKHPYKHVQEAKRIMDIADADNDGQLTIDEVLDKISDLSDSKWVSPERAFHGDI